MKRISSYKSSMTLLFIFVVCIIISTSKLSALADQIDTDKCDSLATDPYDEGRVTYGVFDENLDLSSAEKACRDALTDIPDNARLQYQLGRVLLLRKKSNEAIKILSSSAGKGYVSAMLSLGLVAESGLHPELNLESALAWYRQAAESGSAAGLFMLGRANEKGIAIERDINEAIRLYKMAASKGYGVAMLMSAQKYILGKDVVKDERIGEEYLRNAANENVAMAKYALAMRILSRDANFNEISVAIKHLRESAVQGVNNSTLELAKLYQEGSIVDKKGEEAKRLFCELGPSGVEFAASVYQLDINCQ